MPFKRTLQISDAHMKKLNEIRDKTDKPITKIIYTAIGLYLEMVEKIGYSETEVDKIIGKLFGGRTA